MFFFNFIVMQNNNSRRGAGNPSFQRVIEVWLARRIKTAEGDVVAIRHGGSRTDLWLIPLGSQKPRWVAFEGRASQARVAEMLAAA